MVLPVIGAAVVIAALETIGASAKTGGATESKPKNFEPSADFEKYAARYRRSGGTTQKPVPHKPEPEPIISDDSDDSNDEVLPTPPRATQPSQPVLDKPRGDDTPIPPKETDAVLVMVPEERRAVIDAALDIIRQCNFSKEFAEQVHLITNEMTSGCQGGFVAHMPLIQEASGANPYSDNKVNLCPLLFDDGRATPENLALSLLHEWWHINEVRKGTCAYIIGNGDDRAKRQEEVDADTFASNKLAEHGFSHTLNLATGVN